MSQDFEGKIDQSDLNLILTKLTKLYNNYRQPNVIEEISSSYSPPAIQVSNGDKIFVSDLITLHNHYKTKIGNLNNPDLGMPSQNDIILDDPFESLYNSIEYINFISQQPCYSCDSYGCYCDGPCHYYNSCTCDSTCNSGFICDCDSQCHPYSCGCYDMCYGSYVPPPESGECTCNFGCDQYSACTCNFACYILDSCPCYSQCDGYEQCQCDGSGHYDCNQCFSSNYLCTNNY